MSLKALGVFLILGARSAWGDVTPAAVFSDGMVLQAGRPVPVFGTADPGESVTVECRGQTKTTTAGQDGRWSVRLDPAAAGGPFELTVGGRNRRVIENVLFGEVWHASGQSNMAFPLKKALGATEEIEAATAPTLRFFRGGGPWKVCSPQTAGDFSAMAYFFAAELHRHLNVPVGIIDTSVSGAVIQTYLSDDALKGRPELADRVRRQTDQGVGENYRTLVRPIVPFAVRGTLWCQGEGNRGNPATYRTLLPLMISDWRSGWGDGDTPFLIVQLVGSQQRKEEPWEGRDCAIREIQLEVSRTVPNSALVVSIDLGTTDVHYPDKKPVGRRLALAARALAYGEKVEASGPIFESATFEQGKALVSFTHVGSGLAGRDGRLEGFLLAGRDGKFVRAEALIAGDRVVVSSPKVPTPVSVRYGWERNPACTLINREGLPASPFRSDRWPNPYFEDETP
jgi:sialate O-acetylesterase